MSHPYVVAATRLRLRRAVALRLCSIVSAQVRVSRQRCSSSRGRLTPSYVLPKSQELMLLLLCAVSIVRRQHAGMAREVRMSPVVCIGQYGAQISPMLEAVCLTLGPSRLTIDYKTHIMTY